MEPLKRTPGPKAASAAQLQKSLDAAVGELRATLSRETLADMVPKGAQRPAKKR